MKQTFFKVIEPVIAEVGDLTQAVVLCKILNIAQSMRTQNPKFQQSYLASILALSPDTIGRVLKELSDNGYITYSAMGYGTYRTTQFTITDKTNKLVKSEGKQEKSKESSEEDVLRKIALAEDKVSAKKIADEHHVELTPETVAKIKQIKSQTKTSTND